MSNNSPVANAGVRKGGIDLWKKISYIGIMVVILLINGCTNIGGNSNTSSGSTPQILKI